MLPVRFWSTTRWAVPLTHQTLTHHASLNTTLHVKSDSGLNHDFNKLLRGLCSASEHEQKLVLRHTYLLRNTRVQVVHTGKNQSYANMRVNMGLGSSRHRSTQKEKINTFF